MPDGDYVRFLEEGMGLPNPPGDFLDMQGNPVGTHRGFLHYTIGQRKGLGLAFGEPRFVISKHAAAGTVTLGRQEDLFTRTLFAEDVNLISLPELTEPVRVTAKTRYSQAAAPALLESSGDSRIRLTFDSPQRPSPPARPPCSTRAMWWWAAGRLPPDEATRPGRGQGALMHRPDQGPASGVFLRRAAAGRFSIKNGRETARGRRKERRMTRP